MAQTNTKAGRMPCECCGETVWVKTTSAGKLAYRCEGCGSGHFADKGDRAYRKWQTTMTPHTDPDAKPADPEPPAPEAKPAAKRQAAEPFSMGL